MITFNADEVLEMAERIEHNGAAFYRKAASSASGSAKALFEKFASMEDDHERTFATMRTRLSASQKENLTPDPESEATLYLQAMADGKVFPSSPDRPLTGRESLQEILAVAIGKEKDSIVFYQSLKEVVPPAAGRDKLDEIIRQEIGHILLLTKEMPA